ncbi:hypothetical protein Q3G72_033129 [Acer saccharum]|nr:hypothetical protein Q3G72_033129 [Acer saccharum]
MRLYVFACVRASGEWEGAGAGAGAVGTGTGGEASSDVVAPVLKKSKGTNSPPEDAGGQSVAPLENIDSQMAIEESSEAVGDLPQGSNEEGFDAEKEEVDNTGDKAEELKESEQVDGTSEVELQNDKNNGSGENLDRPTGAEMPSDDGSKDQAEQENQQLIQESESEREEGELVPDVTDVEGVTDVSNVMGSPEIGEGQPDLTATPVVSPARVDDEANVELNEVVNDEGDTIEENAEGSDKSNDGNDQIAAETDQVPEAGMVASEIASTSSTAEHDIPKQSSSTVTSAEVKPVSPVSNAPHIVNLRERARVGAMQRQAGVITPSVGRGRGRTSVRGRGSVELASAGVSISIFNIVSKLFNIPLLSVATSFVAEDIAKNDINDSSEESSLGGSNNGKPVNEKTERKQLSSVSTSLLLSVGIGIFEAVALSLGLGPFLNLMGVSSASDMHGPAQRFLMLRAIGAPATVVSLALQVIFCGFKDTKTPVICGFLMGRTLAVLMTMTLGTSMVAHQGSNAMAAHQICMQVRLAVSLLSDSLAASGKALVASYSSRGDFKTVKEITNFVLKIGVFTSVFLAVILGLSFGSLATVFTKDVKVLDIVTSASQPINALAFIFDGLHYGVSDIPYAAYSMGVFLAAEGSFPVLESLSSVQSLSTEGRRNAYLAIVQARPPHLNNIYLATQRPEQLLKRTQLMECWARWEICVLADRIIVASFLQPVGALNLDRLKKFQERYSSFDDPVLPKFHYRSHYSSAGTVFMFYLSDTQNPPLGETFCSSLLQKLQQIWDEVGESDEERDRMLLQIEKEWLDVYKRKVEQAVKSMAQLLQALSDSKPEEMSGTIKEQLAAIARALEQLWEHKEERVKEFSDVQLQIQKICGEIAGCLNLSDQPPAVDDLSLKKFDEYQAHLQELQKEKERGAEQEGAGAGDGAAVGSGERSVIGRVQERELQKRGAKCDREGARAGATGAGIGAGGYGCGSYWSGERSVIGRVQERELQERGSEQEGTVAGAVGVEGVGELQVWKWNGSESDNCRVGEQEGAGAVVAEQKREGAGAVGAWSIAGARAAGGSGKRNGAGAAMGAAAVARSGERSRWVRDPEPKLQMGGPEQERELLAEFSRSTGGVGGSGSGSYRCGSGEGVRVAAGAKSGSCRRSKERSGSGSGSYSNGERSKSRSCKWLLDWDSGKTHIYHCHVFPDGSYTFKGPFLTHTKTHLQRELGDDNVLMVKFAEEVTDQRSSDYAKYSKIAREGILVGLRRYHFFVFKDGGKEEKRKDPTSSSVKCYFVRIESDASIDMGQQYILSGKRVHEARSMFMHAHTVSSVANYMSR